ncbi:MAG: hypothetical protein KDA84_12105, partial [Planctomycetaceae bacterium]|nr:hypothetical protein [Planctomycetaceae bacterium]
MKGSIVAVIGTVILGVVGWVWYANNQTSQKPVPTRSTPRTSRELAWEAMEKRDVAALSTLLSDP